MVGATPVVSAKVAPVIAPKVTSYAHLPYAVGYRYLLPPGSFPAQPVIQTAQADAAVAVEAAPAAAVKATPVVAASVPATVDVAPSSQYQAQDEAGQYNYGYSSQLSAKQETKTADGVVRGSYSYVDANGLVQKVDYISDVLGFRAVGTNIPGVSTPASAPLIAPKVATYAYLPYAFHHPYYNHLQKH